MNERGEGRVRRRESLSRARRRARSIASGVFRTPACAERGARASIPRGKRSCEICVSSREACAREKALAADRATAVARSKRPRRVRDGIWGRSRVPRRSNERTRRPRAPATGRASLGSFRDLLRRAKAKGDSHCEDGRGGERRVRFRRGMTGKVRRNIRGEPISRSMAAKVARARHPRALSGGLFPVSWLSAFARDMATPGNTGRKPRRATRATLARCAHTGDKRG